MPKTRKIKSKKKSLPVAHGRRLYEQWDHPGFESEYRRLTALENLIVAKGRFTSNEASKATYVYDRELAERLAMWLRKELATLRRLEKGGGSVIRLGKAVSRLDIADIAMTIVENAELDDNLTCLLLELLNLDRHRLNLANNNSLAKVSAVWIDAGDAFHGRAPLGARALAREVSVTAGTILKWRKSVEYKGMVMSAQHALATGPTVSKYVRKNKL